MAEERRSYWLSTGASCLLLASLMGSCAEPPQRPNVVLIVVDTLRADRLLSYGSPVDTAPFLSELADRSVVFESAWSPSSWTLPATVSLLTSVHPFQHGVKNLVGLELGPEDDPVPVNRIPDAVETLAETLKRAGYRTYGVASNILVGSEVGFDRGFDQFVRLEDEDADHVNGVVESWIPDLTSGAPFFLYLHYFDPHDPFHAREPWFSRETAEEGAGWPLRFRVDSLPDLDWLMTRLEPMPLDFVEKRADELSPEDQLRLMNWIRAAYDSEISFVDARIRSIYDALSLDDALVVVTADHGEEFGEHGELTHGHNLYGETVRVPLLVSRPGVPESRRVLTPVSTVDVVPTIRRFLGLPSHAQDVGRDLFGANPGRTVLGVLEGKGMEDDYPKEDDLLSIIVGDHRLLARGDGRLELYDLENDPLELHDLAGDSPEEVQEMLRELRRIKQSVAEYPMTTHMPGPASEAMREHLEGLGYLGKQP